VVYSEEKKAGGLNFAEGGVTGRKVLERKPKLGAKKRTIETEKPVALGKESYRGSGNMSGGGGGVFSSKRKKLGGNSKKRIGEKKAEDISSSSKRRADLARAKGE